ncbi:homocysteine S-methyltransferase family protein [Rhizobium giardinii]|uniref:S-methylmethionine-dependent homocysteine/selenocysteine methylase n=1 Tax=Rhizobium giardinii TaxID=56731 RepID=A0A7W8X8H9_9HYPH|nr:homocysteine S-methyltransferase family protein [Rhizobium giardinii]MBB5537335.1 S-methylmethionine-dependent homocysteine/selenocysteine methylase [Rhizobium giardinii]
MSKYRHDLPQLKGGMYLTDGGMETTLIFHEGADLPHFASFVLLAEPAGRRQLRDYYVRYLDIAGKNGTGFVLDTATWRSNPDWGAKLGYSAEALRAANEDAVELLSELRADYERPGAPIVISGAIGPRGDGYKAGNMDAEEAEAYHATQIETFAGTDADMVTAFTLTSIDEAIGIARAARRMKMPCVISFTVETDGNLVTGRTLRQAIEAVDAATGAYPLYYMINCAHPSHFDDVVAGDGAWLKRIGGIRANASKMSHQELDESETLDAGDPADLGRRYRQLTRQMPQLRVLGGCCGTDHRHVAAICEACFADNRLSA